MKKLLTFIGAIALFAGSAGAVTRTAVTFSDGSLQAGSTTPFNVSAGKIQNATIFNITSSGTYSVNGGTIAYTNAVTSGTVTDSSTYTFKGAGFQGTKTDNSTTTLQGAVFNGTAVDNSTQTHTGAQTLSSMTVTNAFSAQGTTTNDNAGILQIGWSTSTTKLTANVPASAQYVAYSTITLQAGDYEVWGSVSWNRNAATFTVFDLECAITDTPGNSFTNLDVTNSAGTNLGAANLSFGFFHIPIGPFRVSITTPTSYYVKAYTATFTAGTPQVDAYIAARRQR